MPIYGNMAYSQTAALSRKADSGSPQAFAAAVQVISPLFQLLVPEPIEVLAGLPVHKDVLVRNSHFMQCNQLPVFVLFPGDDRVCHHLKFRKPLPKIVSASKKWCGQNLSAPF